MQLKCVTWCIPVSTIKSILIYIKYFHPRAITKKTYRSIQSQSISIENSVEWKCVCVEVRYEALVENFKDKLWRLMFDSKKKSVWK